MATIVLGFILFCGTLLIGGTLGSTDLKAKIEQGKVTVQTEQVTVITITELDQK